MPDTTVTSGNDYTASVVGSVFTNYGSPVQNVGIDVTAPDVDVKLYSNSGIEFNNHVTVGSSGVDDSIYLGYSGNGGVTIGSGATEIYTKLEDGGFNTVKDSGGSYAYYDEINLDNESSDSVKLYGAYKEVFLKQSSADISTTASGDEIYIDLGSTVNLSGAGGNFVSMYWELDTEKLRDYSAGSNSINVYDEADAVIYTSLATKDRIYVQEYSELFLSGKGGNKLYLSNSDVYDQSIAADTIYVEGGVNHIITYPGATDTIDVNASSTVRLYGAGGNTVNIVDGDFSFEANYLRDDSAGPNTVNVLYSYARVAFMYDDSLNVDARGSVYMQGGFGDRITVGDGSLMNLGADTGPGNTVTVTASGDHLAYIYDESTYSASIYVSDSDAKVYNGTSDKNSIMLGGDSFLWLRGFGGNTVDVSDTGNRLYENSNDNPSAGNTIKVYADAGLYLYGDFTSKDTVRVYGYLSAIDTQRTTIDLGGSDGTTLSGSGDNTVNVSGYENYLTEDSTAGNTIKIGAGSGLNLYGSAGADTVVLEGAGSYAFASGDTIEISSGAAYGFVGGNDNTIVIEAVSTIDVSIDTYGDAVTVDTTGGDQRAFVYGTGNAITVEAVSTINSDDEYITLAAGSAGSIVHGSGNTVAIEDSASVWVYASALYDSGAGGIHAFTAFDSGGTESFVDGGGDVIAVGATQAYVDTANGYTVNVIGSGHLYLYGAGGDTVEVNGVDNKVRDESTAGDTIIVNGTGASLNLQYTMGDTVDIGASAAAEIFEGAGKNTINLSGGSLEIYGDESGGHDTVFVSGTGNYIWADSNYGSTINVGAGAELNVYGQYSKDDTIKVSGAGSSIYTDNGFTTIDLGGSVSTELYGDGGNTVVVSGTGNTITEDSFHGNYVEVLGGAGLTLNGTGSDTVDVSGTGASITASGETFILGSASTGTAVTGNGNVIVDEAGFTFSQTGDNLYVIYDGGATPIAEFTGTDNGIVVNADASLTLSDDYIALDNNGASVSVTGNDNTIAVGFESIIQMGAGEEVGASGVVSVYNSGDGLAGTVTGTGNAVTVDAESHIFAYGAYGINVAGAGNSVYLFGNGGDTVNVTGFEDVLYDFSAGANTINVVSGDVAYLHLYNVGDVVNVGGKAGSAAVLYQGGGDTINLESGLYTGFADESDSTNTVNVGNATKAGIYTEFPYDTINISGGSYAKLFGYGGNTVVVSGTGNTIYEDSDLGDALGNTINVEAGAGLSLIGEYSNYDTVVVSGSGSSIYTIYGDTIEFNGGASSTITGFGGNTFVVSGGGNSITDDSLYGSTIEVSGGVSGLTLAGTSIGMDTIVVSGIDNTISAAGGYLEFAGDSQATLEGSGKNTLVVSGTAATIVDLSTNSDVVELEAGTSANITAYHDTITAQAGAQNVAVNLAGGVELTSLTADGDSSVGIAASNTSGVQFINATGDTIDISANNTTVYVFDSSFSAGHSSDTFNVSGTGDVVKFVNSMISAAAAFGPGNPGFPTVEDSYSGATAISLVSHA